MSSSDKTKEVLEQILAQLYAEQAKKDTKGNGSYLVAQDGQLLGKITNNAYDNESISNQYGPYGSQYSPTSIFNPYSIYGSVYGAQSINNPYCSTPPKLFINGRLIGHVTANQYVANRISPEAFLYTLKNDLQSLMAGNVIQSESQTRQLRKESFIEAADGVFLGNLNKNRMDANSIFNQFGPYGNKFSQTCIFNKFSTYGNQFSNLSPYNQFTQTPPKIYISGAFWGYLTNNIALSPRVSPDEIHDWAMRNIS